MGRQPPPAGQSGRFGLGGSRGRPGRGASGRATPAAATRGGAGGRPSTAAQGGLEQRQALRPLDHWGAWDLGRVGWRRILGNSTACRGPVFTSGSWLSGTGLRLRLARLAHVLAALGVRRPGQPPWIDDVRWVTGDRLRGSVERTHRVQRWIAATTSTWSGSSSPATAPPVSLRITSSDVRQRRFIVNASSLPMVMGTRTAGGPDQRPRLTWELYKGRMPMDRLRPGRRPIGGGESKA